MLPRPLSISFRNRQGQSLVPVPPVCVHDLDLMDQLAGGDLLRDSGDTGVVTDFKEAVNKYKDALAQAESSLP